MKKRPTRDGVARFLRDVERDLAKALTISDVCRTIGVAQNGLPSLATATQPR
jgi:hypothetical protein